MKKKSKGKKRAKPGKALRQRLSRSSRAAAAPKSMLAHYPRYGERWSDPEDKKLVALREQFSHRYGEPSAIYRIAERLGRTPEAVQKRIDVLGIRRRYKRVAAERS